MYNRRHLEQIAEQEARRWKLNPAVVKAVIQVESSWNPRARRYESGKDAREGNKRDDGEWEINASWGLMQIMGYTARQLGFPRQWPFDLLYSPELNIYLGCKLLRLLLDRVERVARMNALSPLAVALARYNGGPRGNPRKDGTLRNQHYVNKVFKAMEAYR